MPGPLIPVIAVLIVVFGVVAFYASRETRAETKRTGKYPKGHYMGQGMGIGIAIGAAFGASMEKKHAQELRPMTEKEKTMKRRGVALALVLLIVTMLIAVYLYFLKS